MKCLASFSAAVVLLSSVSAQAPPVTDWNVFVAPEQGIQERTVGLVHRDGNAFVVHSRTGPGTARTARLSKVGPEGKIEWERPVGDSTASDVVAGRPMANAQGEPTVRSVVTSGGSESCVLERWDRWGDRKWAVQSATLDLAAFDPVRWSGSTPGALILWAGRSGFPRLYRLDRLGPTGLVSASNSLSGLIPFLQTVTSVQESPSGDSFISGTYGSGTSFVASLSPDLQAVNWTLSFGSNVVTQTRACQDGGIAVAMKWEFGDTSQDLVKIDRLGRVEWLVNYYRDSSHGLIAQSLSEGPNGRIYVRAFLDWGGVKQESTGHVYSFKPNGDWAWFGEFFREIRSSVSSVEPGPAECATVAYGGNDGSANSSSAIEFVSGNGEHVWLKPFTPGTYGFESLAPEVVVDPDDAVIVAGTASKSGEPDRRWLAKYVLVGTGTLPPTAFKVLVGKVDQGGLSALKSRDGSAMVVSPIGSGAGSFRTQVEVDGVQSLFERTPVSVNVAGRLSTTGTAAMTVEQWDWTKSRWITVKSATALTAQTESAVWPFPGPYARFVGSGGKMKTRLTFDFRPPSGSLTPRVMLDKCNWTALAP
ncbi:MAG: hypothetical protein JST30_15480 [Armatimonadetes bacterium]|nr:hypothetical protein [Armatimonadota bacterium]